MLNDDFLPGGVYCSFGLIVTQMESIRLGFCWIRPETMPGRVATYYSESI